MEFMHIAPKGMVAVHKMLMDTGVALIEGGEQGLFTPMHMLVFQKPATAGGGEAGAAKP